MKIKIFLDDVRLPFWLYDDYNEWILVKNDIELKNLVLENINNIDSISFDNDLGIDSNGDILPDGYSCLNWLIENDIFIPNIIVHSDNVIANEQIYGKAMNWINFLINEIEV